MGSVVRRKAGLEFDGDMYEGTIMQLMDAPERFLLLARLPNDLYRVIVSFKGTIDDNDKDKARELFQDVIRVVGGRRAAGPAQMGFEMARVEEAGYQILAQERDSGGRLGTLTLAVRQTRHELRHARRVQRGLEAGHADRGTCDRRHGRDPQHPHGARQTVCGSHEGDATGLLARRRRAQHLWSELPLRRRKCGGREGAAGAWAARAERGAARRAAARPDRRRVVHAAAGARGGG
ncbi:hypothetical protein FGB62_251g013 [Gracilaria domingensis]|nr:hypothetical protein FGB62_251g013 [Gracilaria domingensis]